MRQFYLRDEHNHPVACVATDLNRENLTVTAAVATHNPVDIFNRRVARKVAQGRLTSKPQYTFVTVPGTRLKPHLVKAIAEDHNIPLRTRKAARKWLKDHPGPPKAA